MAGPYERVLELARRERDAVEAGDWERMLALQAEQGELREQLARAAAPVPPSARPALEEAVRLNAEVVRSIQRALSGIQAELVELGRSREAAAGYGGAVERAAQLAWEG